MVFTLAFTYRNRDLSIVTKCLNSLQNQSNKDFKVGIVDYGSEKYFAEGIAKLVNEYDFVTLISCPVSKQLWNKSRAINILLKRTDTPYFFVGDIDMIFRHDFVEKLHVLKSPMQAIYFRVGFLNKEESTTALLFEKYQPTHYSNHLATGMTLYPTDLLKSINGYDELYHGWGAEDTDVHYRLKNRGIPVVFFEEILILHQWHSKNYREKDSTLPFHSQLEKINHQYLLFNQQNKSITANNGDEWGRIPDNNKYELLNRQLPEVFITNEIHEFEAFLISKLQNLDQVAVQIIIKQNVAYKTFKNSLKKMLGKNYLKFYSMEEINDKVLEFMVSNFRNQPYQFSFDRKNNTIVLRIVLK